MHHENYSRIIRIISERSELRICEFAVDVGNKPLPRISSYKVKCSRFYEIYFQNIDAFNETEIIAPFYLYVKFYRRGKFRLVKLAKCMNLDFISLIAASVCSHINVYSFWMRMKLRGILKYLSK